MSTSDDLRRIALSLEGTTEAPHFDRTAFRARRIYVTLAADGHTANFMFTPDQQQFKCLTAPDTFAPVANAWGKRGATTAILAMLTNAELENALRLAWRRAVANRPQQGRVQNASDRSDRGHSPEPKKAPHATSLAVIAIPTAGKQRDTPGWRSPRRAERLRRLTPHRRNLTGCDQPTV